MPTVRATGVGDARTRSADPGTRPWRRSGGADLVVVLVRLDRVEVRGRRRAHPRADAGPRAATGAGSACCPASGWACPAGSVRPAPASRWPPSSRSAARRRSSGVRRWCSGRPATCGPGCGGPRGCSPPAERGLLPGLVVGDTSRMPAGAGRRLPDRRADAPHRGERRQPRDRRRLRAASSARWAGCAGAGCRRSAALAMAGFVVLARPQPSVLRAAVMGAVASARAGHRAAPRAAWPRSAAAVLVPAAGRPVAGAVVRLRALGAGDRRPGAARAGLGADLAARGLPRRLAEARRGAGSRRSSACAPVVVLLSGQVSLVAVPANLLAAPAVAPATVLGVLATVRRAAERRAGGRCSATAAGVPVWWIVPVAHAVRRGARRPRSTGRRRCGGALVLARCCPSRSCCSGASRRAARWRAAGASRSLLGVALVVPATSRLAAATAGCSPSATSARATPGARGPRRYRGGGRRRAGPARWSTGACAGSASAGCRSCCSPTSTPTTSRACPGVLRGRRVGEVAIGRYDEPAAELARVRRWAERRRRAAHAVVDRASRMSVGPVPWQVLWPARVIDEESVAQQREPRPAGPVARACGCCSPATSSRRRSAPCWSAAGCPRSTCSRSPTTARPTRSRSCSPPPGRGSR